MKQPGNFRSGKPVSSPSPANLPAYKSLWKGRDGVWGREGKLFSRKVFLPFPNISNMLQQLAFPVEEAGTGGRRHRLGRILLHAGEEGIPGGLKLGAMHRDVQGPRGIDPCVLPIAAGPEAFPLGALKTSFGLMPRGSCRPMPIGQKPASTMPSGSGLVFGRARKSSLVSSGLTNAALKPSFAKLASVKALAALQNGPATRSTSRPLKNAACHGSLQTKCFAPLRMASLMMRFQSSSSSGQMTGGSHHAMFGATVRDTSRTDLGESHRPITELRLRRVSEP